MDRQKKFYTALGIYAVLGILICLTMSDLPVSLGGVGQIGIRSLTLAVLAIFALRTVLHWRAERIREEQEKQHEEESSR